MLQLNSPEMANTNTASNHRIEIGKWFWKIIILEKKIYVIIANGAQNNNISKWM